MTALTNTAPFKGSFQTCSGRPASCSRRALVCRAQAQQHGWEKNIGVQLLAAGLAATALVATPSIADAKVVIEQPKVKKVFQGGKKAVQQAAPQQSSSGGPSLPSISLPSVSLPSVSLPSLPSVGLPSIPGPNLSGLDISPSDGLDPRAIALPGAILGIGAAAFAALRFDSGFRDMMREGLVKDSTGYAGYEEAVDEYGAAGQRALNKGTKKVAKTASKAKGKAKGAAKEGGGLFGIFGKK